MKRRKNRQAIASAKVAVQTEATYTMWLLGSLPLMAIASISYLMLQAL